MALPPTIHTYHCLCTSLLLASTHTLSSLPRRQPTSSSTPPTETGDIILPLPSAPPQFALPTDSNSDNDSEIDETTDTNTKGKGKSEALSRVAEEATVPSAGYTILISLFSSSNPTIIRRTDGFEKRLLYRCGRCRVVVGYEIVGAGGDAMDIDGDGGAAQGQGVEESYKGKILYLLPDGIVSTDVMASGKKIIEADVDIGTGAGVFE